MKSTDEELEYYLRLFEFLSDDRKEIVENICKFSLGLCSKCRWLSGCYMCDPEKALKYHLSKQGLVPLGKHTKVEPKPSEKPLAANGMS